MVSDALESSQGIKLKGLRIFAIWMILHTHTHPCMPADNMNPKKGRLGPLKGPTGMAQSRRVIPPGATFDNKIRRGLFLPIKLGRGPYL